MAKKLYVGNLPYSFQDQDLGDVFAQFGAVDSSRVITDRDTGRSKGFGFVEMADDAEADKALSELNGSEVSGRTIRVDVAVDRQGGSRGGRR